MLWLPVPRPGCLGIRRQVNKNKRVFDPLELARGAYIRHGIGKVQFCDTIKH